MTMRIAEALQVTRVTRLARVRANASEFASAAWDRRATELVKPATTVAPKGVGSPVPIADK